MDITLRPEHQKAIAKAIESGAYQSPDDVIARALDVLRDEEDWLQENRNEIADKIEKAFAQFERGEYFSPDQSRADMEKRKAAWRNEQNH
jgi:Arc/MetJ-type ribon-helix-helix transcriptional regulator